MVYQVHYNGSVENVTSPTTELTFTAPSLPDGVFADNITVTVTAINRFGCGVSSDPDSAEISKLYPIRKLLACNNLESTMDLQRFPPCNKVVLVDFYQHILMFHILLIL